MIPHSEAAGNLRAAVEANATEKAAIRRRQSDDTVGWAERATLKTRLRELDAEDVIVWDELRMRECKARAEAA